MKIVHVETIFSCGAYAASAHWAQTRKSLHAAVKRCTWPPGSKKFTIYPESGKKRGEGNGVVPIRAEFIKQLQKLEWTIEGPAKNHLDQRIGDFDAVLTGPCWTDCGGVGDRQYFVEPPLDEQAHNAGLNWRYRSRHLVRAVAKTLRLSH